MNDVLKRLDAWWHERFAFLRYPSNLLRERAVATKQAGLINRHAAQKSYPIRAVRYWWAHCALLDEIRQHQKQIVIADVGCSKGIFKRFVGDIPHARWVGLDWKTDREFLEKFSYEEVHECDFDMPLPLPNDSVDVVIFLHVLEHLQRPSFTMAELSRILRPGGLILAGSPVAPRWIARVREWQFRSRMKRGKLKIGGHINSLDCERWRALVEKSGLRVQTLCGTFFLRWSQNPLENYAGWLRLNLLWGALFPPLGGEVYLAARKQREEGNGQRMDVADCG